MRKLQRSFIPTAATLGNLCSGIGALLLAMDGRVDFAALLILVAMLFDSMDGALARVFHASSEFGAEMDSLADMVSFGAAPGVLVASILSERSHPICWLVAVAFAVCAALRLARYNVNRSEAPSQEGFTGLPTTGAGGCIAGAVLTHSVLMEQGVEVGLVFLPVLALLLAFLMVSPLPYPHVGSIVARSPLPAAGGAVALAGLGIVYWDYEIVFFIFFFAYAFSGPALAVHEKVKASREARWM